MNKWEDAVHKNNDSCYCASDSGLFIPSRQLSFIVAGLLFMLFACFMGGYFYAKRTQATGFVLQMRQEAFDDDNHVQEPVITDEEAFESEIIEQDTPMFIGDNEKEAESTVIYAENNTQSIAEPILQFYAELIGFGTEKAAHAFVQKLSNKNIEAIVKIRTSKTAKGRTIHWYQVVTPAYHDKEALTTLVSRLAKEERLKDINIKSC